MRAIPTIVKRRKQRGPEHWEIKGTCKLPIQKILQNAIRPSKWIPLMITNMLLQLIFLSYSTRFSKMISIESSLFNPFNLFRCSFYVIIQFWSLGLWDLYCGKVWSVAFQLHFIGEKISLNYWNNIKWPRQQFIRFTPLPVRASYGFITHEPWEQL